MRTSIVACIQRLYRFRRARQRNASIHFQITRTGTIPVYPLLDTAHHGVETPSPNLSLADWPGCEIPSHWGLLNIHSMRLVSSTCYCVVVAIAVVILVEVVLIVAILTCGRVLIYLLLLCFSYHFRTA